MILAKKPITNSPKQEEGPCCIPDWYATNRGPSITTVSWHYYFCQNEKSSIFAKFYNIVSLKKMEKSSILAEIWKIINGRILLHIRWVPKVCQNFWYQILLSKSPLVWYQKVKFWHSFGTHLRLEEFDHCLENSTYIGLF